MRYDLLDMTFIVPVRIDSVVRLENLIMSVEFLVSHYQTHIHILEAARYSNQLIRRLLPDPSVEYCFQQDKDPVFHRTRWLNQMLLKVKTPLVCVWDADILMNPIQLVEAADQVRSGQFDMAYPYDGDFLDTSDILRAYYWEHRDLSFLERHRGKMNSLYTVKDVLGAVGGAFVANTEKYISVGMENEDFYGWGLEDGERYYRWLSFGCRIYRSTGCLFHLSHPRDMNGQFRSQEHHQKAVYDMNRVVDYSYSQLVSEYCHKMKR